MKLKDAMKDIGTAIETPEDRKKREQEMNRKRQLRFTRKLRETGLTKVTVIVPIDSVGAVRALEEALRSRLT